MSTTAIPTVLRMTGRQHAALTAHLYPGDGLEAAALALCGRRCGDERHVLAVHRLLPIPHDECERTADRVSWPTRFVADALADARGLAVLKVHSHPTGYPDFSAYDDNSDRRVFGFVHDWLEDQQNDLPHASAVFLPDGHVFGRSVLRDGSFEPLERVVIVGDDLRLCMSAQRAEDEPVPAFALRHAQAFGRGTFELLQRLSVAVVGCSGTGSQVVEQLARLGVGELVLVDPEVVGPENLNRITNAGADDVGRQKVEVLSEAIARMNTGTVVHPIAVTLSDIGTLHRVAACDVAFGCVDSLEGRDVLNRLCAYYGLAFFDLGVGLVADGAGGVDRVAGAVQYLQPDGSSLLSRGVYTAEALAAELLRRYAPDDYARLRDEKYIRGAAEGETPAVISVNALIASLAVNELIARLHPYRLDPNAKFARWQVGLEGGLFAHAPAGPPCPHLALKAGRGDVEPSLDLPYLSASAITEEEA